MAKFEGPKAGDPIQMSGAGALQVPDSPIVPFIEGDGTGPDIWRASQAILDAAVTKAYGGKRKIAWYEVFAGEKVKKKFDTWLPDETLDTIEKLVNQRIRENLPGWKFRSGCPRMCAGHRR